MRSLVTLALGRTPPRLLVNHRLQHQLGSDASPLAWTTTTSACVLGCRTPSALAVPDVPTARERWTRQREEKRSHGDVPSCGRSGGFRQVPPRDSTSSSRPQGEASRPSSSATTATRSPWKCGRTTRLANLRLPEVHRREPGCGSLRARPPSNRSAITAFPLDDGQGTSRRRQVLPASTSRTPRCGPSPLGDDLVRARPRRRGRGRS